MSYSCDTIIVLARVRCVIWNAILKVTDGHKQVLMSRVNVYFMRAPKTGSCMLMIYLYRTSFNSDNPIQKMDCYYHTVL